MPLVRSAKSVIITTIIAAAVVRTIPPLPTLTRAIKVAIATINLIELLPTEGPLDFANAAKTMEVTRTLIIRMTAASSTQTVLRSLAVLALLQRPSITFPMTLFASSPCVFAKQIKTWIPEAIIAMSVIAIVAAAEDIGLLAVTVATAAAVAVAGPHTEMMGRTPPQIKRM